MNPDLSDTIRQLIHDFVSESHDRSQMRKLQKTAEKYELLPLGFFWDPACITPNGDIVSFSWDDHDNRRIETDRRLVNTILFSGIKKYPELIELMPTRNEHDIECEYCGGTGIAQFAKKLNQPAIVCYCGGLGWVPEKR